MKPNRSSSPRRKISMTTRKKKRSSPYDDVTQHLLERLKSAGVEVGSTRELLQIGLATMVDMAETSPEDHVPYLNSFKILSNSSKTETHICKGGEVWTVVSRETEESPLSVETFDVAPLPAVNFSDTIERNDAVKVNADIEVEEW